MKFKITNNLKNANQNQPIENAVLESCEIWEELYEPEELYNFKNKNMSWGSQGYKHHISKDGIKIRSTGEFEKIWIIDIKNLNELMKLLEKYYFFKIIKNDNNYYYDEIILSDSIRY